MKRGSKYTKGSKVKIVRKGMLYSQFEKWAKRKGATNWEAGRYPDIYELFTVVASGLHTPEDINGYTKCNRLLVLIEDKYGRQFIMEDRGLESIEEFIEYEEMTI